MEEHATDNVSSKMTASHPSVQAQIEQVNRDIIRRRSELHADLSENVVLENRIISERLSMINGLQKHLSHSKNVKMAYNKQEVPDEFSHGAVSRGQLHRRYPQRY